MKKKLVVYLLSYNRPEYVGEAIDSILTQDYADFELVISENSPNDSVLRTLETSPKYKNIKIIKRSPSLPSLEHFKTVLKEVQTYEYAMLFHDDDILLPQAISEMMQKLESDSNLAAVACNAYITKNRENTDKVLSPFITNDIVIISQRQLIKRYLFRKLSHPPFPSYIYRTSKLENNIFDPIDGGKYSDVSFLVKLVRSGRIYWLAKPLMRYRQHKQNDSVNINLHDLFKLSLFFIKTSPSLFLFVSYYFFKLTLKKSIR